MRLLSCRPLASAVALLLAAAAPIIADPKPASIDGPAVAWSFDTGKEVVAAPVLADGVLYCGSTGYALYALDAATGGLIWKLNTKFPVSAKAAVAGDLVCFECGNILSGVDRRTGKVLWEFAAKPFRPIASMDLTDYHRSSPVIVDGVAYYGDDWGNLNGVDVRDGKLVFQYTTPTQRPIRATPAVHDGKVFFGDWEGEVYAVSLAERKLLWQHTQENCRPYYGAVVSEFVVHDGLVYFGSQHDVFAPLDAATGKPAWTFTEPKHTYLPATPLLHEGRVITATTIFTNSVLCLARGDLVWAFQGEGIFFTKPALHGSTLLVNSTNFGGTGYLYLLDVRTGELRHSLRIEKASPSAPAVDAERVYLGAGDGRLYALKLAELRPSAP